MGVVWNALSSRRGQRGKTPENPKGKTYNGLML
jgi:hypothetical protein